MAQNKARKNEKNLIRTDFEYNDTKDSFKGVDFSSSDGRCDEEHFAYLVNLYRDKEKKDGAALESVPGYRKINKTFLHAGEIYGIYEHTFITNGTRETYVLVHKGNYLYGFLHERRDFFETLSPIASVSSESSFGFSYGGAFYLLDGETIWVMKSPLEVCVLGGAGDDAYIPLLYQNGMPYEARNMLSGLFELERELEKGESGDNSQGLFLRECFLGSQRGLEVYGMEEGRRVVAIPPYFSFHGELLPVLAVAPEAFKSRDIVTAVFAPSVKLIGKNAFFGCRSLERVLIHGATEIRSEAFKGCSALTDLAVQSTVMGVAENAFEGCDAVSRVYLTDAARKGWLSRFEAKASFYGNTLFFWKEIGESLHVFSGSGSYQDLEAVYGEESHALVDFRFGSTFVVTEQSANIYFTANVENTVAYAQYVMQGGDTWNASRHIFVSVCDAFGGINTRDEVEAFVISIPTDTERVDSVWVDGKELSTKMDATSGYYRIDYAKGLMTGVRVLLPRKRSDGAKLLVRCYAEKMAGDGLDDFYRANPHYRGTPMQAIHACRFAAVFDGNIFLGGNPALPDTVFYSVTPKRSGGRLSFASTAYLACRDTVGEVSALMVHPLYLAIVKDDSLYGVTRKSGTDALHERYEIDGFCLSPAFCGGTHIFGDEPLYLTERGVMALKPGKAWEEGRIENRSFYIDGLLKRLSCQNAVFAEWKGYLVLLVDGKIFLADASIAEKKNGVLAYEWYLLDGIGHYEGDFLRYHHLSHDPIVRDKRLTSLTVDGNPLLILGREDAVKGDVFGKVADDCDVTVHYTIGEDGSYYLVDSHGQKEGGFFSPATKLLSLQGCLYFSTSDGYLFCFNTDKRGKSVLINDTLFGVASDEIHSSYYSFDGHAYPSVLITGKVDMGVPHLLKRTVPRSLVIRAKSMPHSVFDVSVRCDDGPWEKVGCVVANELELLDADRFVFSPDERVSEPMRDLNQSFLSKQVMVSAEVFESPIGLDALAYRYKMAGRVKGRTK